MILLDTDHLSIILQKQAAQHVPLVARLATADDQEIGTTIVSVQEVFAGWTARLNRSRNISDELHPYSELMNLVNFLQTSMIIPFTRAAADEFERLRAAGVRVGTMDLKIACIAKTHDALLLSANLRDHRLVPDLRVEDWMN